MPEYADIWDVFSDVGYHYTYAAKGEVLLNKERWCIEPSFITPIVPYPVPAKWVDLIIKARKEISVFSYPGATMGVMIAEDRFRISEDGTYGVSVKQMSIGEIKQEYGKDLYHG